MSNDLLSIVVPVYNERFALPELVRRVDAAVATLGVTLEYVFVDDGSTDGSFEWLRELSCRDERIRALRLSRNMGHQAALTCGLEHAAGDVVVTMDGDLQHPPEELPAMVRAWREGAQVVHMAKRRDAHRSTAASLGAALFYRLFNAVAEIRLDPDGSDFRLLDRTALEALNGIGERVRFIRGLTRFIGFRQVTLEYEVAARHSGRPGYTLAKLWRLAVDGFTSFSNLPLVLPAFVGGGLMALAGLWAGAAVLGGTGLLAPLVVGLFGLQFVFHGVLGAYLHKLLREVADRPAYIVAEHIEARREPGRRPAAGGQ